jgi:hypothetical protein
MRRLAHAPNIALASLWVDLLRQAGIDASVQRYFASSIAGDIPPDQAEPEIWIADEAQFDRAQTLLADMRRPFWRHWACPGYHEIIDGPFEQCWQCGTNMPA